MKKTLISLLVGISMVAMVGCTSNEIKSHVENNTTIVEENGEVDNLIYKQREKDTKIANAYMWDEIGLSEIDNYFKDIKDSSIYNYEVFGELTEQQKDFCLDYIDLIDSIVKDSMIISNDPEEFYNSLNDFYNEHGYRINGGLNTNNNTKPDDGDIFILEQRGFDEYVINQYINGEISLESFKKHFSCEAAYPFYNYTEFTCFFSNSNQKSFCEAYTEFCEGMINYYPQDEPIADVIDKLAVVYDTYGYTSDKVIQWEEENK
jgi:hypothetical protein